ncbi:MAG TPA: cellulase [Ruminococcaceae bacterium]|nr:cellulase [Oscillospiraceae bacterium]
MLNSIRAFSSLNGVSGRENSVRDYIISQLTDTCDYTVDAMGNLLVTVTGQNRAKNRVMLAAHMDEVGMIVTYITDDGLIKFANVGGIETAVLLGRRVKVGEHGLVGVVGVVPIHLRRDEDELTYPSKDSLYIDVGADSAEELKTLVSPGDAIVFDSEFYQFGNCVKGKALDDRAGCALLLDMIKKGTEYDMLFAFTVQEEVGLRGAGCAAFALDPDYAIVVETTTAADLAGAEGEKKVCELGKGAVIPFMDRTTVYSPKLYRRAQEITKEKGIAMQTKTMVAGGNDAGIIHKTGSGVQTLTVSFACRYLHSPCCVIHKDDIGQMRFAVEAIAEDMANA